MRILFLWLMGYTFFEVKEGCLSVVASTLLRLGISARIKNGRVRLSSSDLKKINATSIGQMLVPLCSKGLFPFFVFFLKQKFTVCALIFVLLLNILLSGLVFDVRISGNLEVPSYKIREALDSLGLRIGKRFSSLDTSSIEVGLLNSFDDIAWVNINRRGTVAYVEVVERKGAGAPENKDSRPSNIVAACDAVIEEITVKSGKAMVSAGDVVRTGDILISGVIDSEGGTSFIKAEGSVIGSVTGTVTAVAMQNEEVRVGFDTKYVELRLNILNISANIFKNYRNCVDGCDIIVDNEYFCTPGGTRLPFGYTCKLAVSEKTVEVSYTEAEMIMRAYEKHKMALDLALGGCELVGIKTVGTMGEGSYTVSSSVRYLMNLGEERWIEISTNK